MMNYYNARFFDGERPVPVEGRMYATDAALHFDADDHSKSLMFAWNEVADCRRDNDKIIVTLSAAGSHSPSAHRELICSDSACRDEIYSRLYRHGALSFRFSGNKKRLVAGLSLAGILFAIGIWAFFTQSYRLVPVRTETALGTRIISSVQKFSSEYNDPAQMKRISRMVSKLRPADSQYTYTVHLVNDPQINAFAVPGGGILIFKGLLDAKPDDDELAGVLAHESSHVEYRHGLRQMIRFVGLSYIFHIAAGAGLDQVQGISTISDISSLIVLFKYSRGYELEADANAVVLTKKAGYDPKGIARFLEKMSSQQKGIVPPAYLSTHPATAERIKKIEELSKR
jgi:Zn-dependent protease with chaperone function